MRVCVCWGQTHHSDVGQVRKASGVVDRKSGVRRGRHWRADKRQEEVSTTPTRPCDLRGGRREQKKSATWGARLLAVRLHGDLVVVVVLVEVPRGVQQLLAGRLPVLPVCGLQAWKC